MSTLTHAQAAPCVRANPYLDGGIEPLALSEDEIDAVVALMFSFTDDRFGDQNQMSFDKQHATAQTQRPFRDNALAMRQTLPFEQRVTEPAQPRKLEQPQ